MEKQSEQGSSGTPQDQTGGSGSSNDPAPSPNPLPPPQGKYEVLIKSADRPTVSVIPDKD